MKNLKIYIIAGEASGDLYGAGLMRGIKSKNDAVEFFGVGGSNMQAEGLKSLFPMSELSIMGFWEVLPHIFSLLRRIKQVVSDIKSVNPDIVITIDSPGFNFKIAEKLQSCGIKLVHYVAPSVWAYKPKRAFKVARLYNHLIEILPFEPSYFDAVGLPNTYIGHPITEQKHNYDGTLFRKKYSITEDTKLLCIMPGSRHTEVKKLLPVFAETIMILKTKIDNLQVIVPAVEAVEKEVRAFFEGFPVRVVIVTGNTDKYNAYAACNAGLIKSGTGTLEVAMSGLPMVIAYKVSYITSLIVKMMIKIKYANLINLVMDKEIIPEMIQRKCRPDLLADKLLDIMKSPKSQVKEINKALKILGMGQKLKPSEKAAQLILKLIK